jgi:hypothetical protein
MPYNLITSSALAQQVAQAVTNYRTGWQSVDSELYGLCRRRSNLRDFDDVYTKVVIIARVYNAGLNRAWKGSSDPDPEVQIAKCIMSQADLVASALQELASQPLDRASLVEIVALHGKLTRALLAPAGNIWLTSFVSKYLHFHCPIVPVYDSRANAKIRQGFVARPDMCRLQVAVGEPNDRVRAYYKFVTAFVALYERIYAQPNLQPSVKEVDYLLLGKGNQQVQWTAPSLPPEDGV